MTNSELQALGDRLEHAVAARIAARRPRRRHRNLLLLAAALAVALPGLAVAGRAWVSEADVAAGLPAGTKALAGTDPTCEVVEEGVEYECELARAPAPEVADWKGTVEPTVDATKHVNGGCRALTSDGLRWRCYLGQAAVDQRIIGPGFLGEYAPSPGVG